jgi:hypothetical protein
VVHGSDLEAAYQLLPDGRVRLALSPASGTTANLRRDGRLTLITPFEKGMCELRLDVTEREHAIDGLSLTVFEG